MNFIDVLAIIIAGNESEDPHSIYIMSHIKKITKEENGNFIAHKKRANLHLL